MTDSAVARTTGYASGEHKADTVQSMSQRSSYEGHPSMIIWYSSENGKSGQIRMQDKHESRAFLLQANTLTAEEYSTLKNIIMRVNTKSQYITDDMKVLIVTSRIADSTLTATPWREGLRPAEYSYSSTQGPITEFNTKHIAEVLVWSLKVASGEVLEAKLSPGTMSKVKEQNFLQLKELAFNDAFATGEFFHFVKLQVLNVPEEPKVTTSPPLNRSASYVDWSRVGPAFSGV